VRNWHPLSKLTIVIGLGVLAVVWWLDQGWPGETRVAEAVTSSASEATPAVLVAGPAPAPASSADPDQSRRALPPVDAFVSMVDRPLFAPARRPIDPDFEVADLELSPWTVEPAAAPVYPDVSFIGSIEENGRVRALLGDGGNVRGVALGDTVDGWTVFDIDARRLKLSLNGEILELTILE
jgi:hypothetical protein